MIKDPIKTTESLIGAISCVLIKTKTSDCRRPKTSDWSIEDEIEKF